MSIIINWCKNHFPCHYLSSSGLRLAQKGSTRNTEVGITLYWDFSFFINISLGKVKFQAIMKKSYNFYCNIQAPSQQYCCQTAIEKATAAISNNNYMNITYYVFPHNFMKIDLDKNHIGFGVKAILSIFTY